MQVRERSIIQLKISDALWRVRARQKITQYREQYMQVCEWFA